MSKCCRVSPPSVQESRRLFIGKADNALSFNLRLWQCLRGTFWFTVVGCGFAYSGWPLVGQSIDRDVGNKGEPSIVNESRFRIVNKRRFGKLGPTKVSAILRECVHEFLLSLLLDLVRGEKGQTFRYVQFLIMLVDQSESELGPDGVFRIAI